MIPLEEQIGNRCIHFTGLANKTCKKEVNYDVVKDKSSSPYKVPCLKHEGMHGGHCPHAEFPTKEEIQKEVDEIKAMTNKTVGALAIVKSQIKKTGELSGSVECPGCGGALKYAMAKVNGHTSASCSTCSVGWIE